MSSVLVYAVNPDVRERVKLAIGRFPAEDLDAVTFIDAADAAAVLDAIEHDEADVCVLDGEAAPVGGMGLARQIHNEFRARPGTVLLIARRDDRWLATWSMADAVVPYPIDPAELTDAVVTLLRARATHKIASVSTPAIAAHHA